MAKINSIDDNLEYLLFQSQMLTGVAYVLWDSLAKSEAGENNRTRGLAAYFLYDEMEKFTASFRNQIEKLSEETSARE